MSTLSTKHGFNIIISEEMIGNKKIFIARCIDIDVSSQGSSIVEAEENLKEAIELNLKTYPELKKEIPTKELMSPMISKIFL